MKRLTEKSFFKFPFFSTNQKFFSGNLQDGGGNVQNLVEGDHHRHVPQHRLPQHPGRQVGQHHVGGGQRRQQDRVPTLLPPVLGYVSRRVPLPPHLHPAQPLRRQADGGPADGGHQEAAGAEAQRGRGARSGHKSGASGWSPI